MSSRPLVLYHGGSCADGFASAWIAHRKLGDDADYVPVNYGQDPPEAALDRDRPLYVLDFSYPGAVMFKLAAMRHQEMIVCDHHRTAKDALHGLEIQLLTNNCGDALTVRFDLAKSGARLTWEHFNPGEPAPWLVDYTEDRDLGRTFNGTSTLPTSKQINAALASYPFDFAVWDNFNQWPVYGPDLSGFSREGAAILRYQAQQVENQCKNAVEIDLDGHKVLSVNATLLISEIAGKLAESRPFGATYFIRADGKRVWSLRSREGGVDVSEIAKRHGGGGHKQAAGYEE